MTESEPITPPERTGKHEALDVFLGDWRAEGWSYGGPEQSAVDPKAVRDRWTSTHNARWHSGEFFLIHDERATIGSDGQTLDTLGIIGVDPATDRYFARNFENHGFYRLYEVQRDGDVWTFAGATERARIEFSDEGRTQTITWEWLKDGAWLPLCDRVARRSGSAAARE
jgi:Protein of unknown function (DUF1579)